MNWRKLMSEGNTPQLFIYKPDDSMDELTDQSQERALAACEAKRTEILALLQQHNVTEARIAPRNSANDHNYPLVSCAINFEQEGPDDLGAALKLTKEIENLIGCAIEPLKIDRDN